MIDLTLTYHNIMGHLKEEGFEEHSVISNIYRTPNVLHKKSFLDSLRTIKGTIIEDKWIIGWDLNLKTSFNDKK